MTDIVLVNPASSHGIYGPLGSSLIAVEPPQWLRIIAAYLRDHGHSVVCIDAEAEQCSAREVAERIEAIDPILVGLVVFGHMPSASSQQMFGAREVADAISALNPAREVVISGGHVSALPGRTLIEEPVSFAAKGEGPVTIDGLLKFLKDGSPELWEIPGLVWHGQAGVVVNAPAPPLDINKDLHGQAWDLLPMHLYRSHNWQALGDLAARQPYASIYTTLNCPYHCEFCCIAAPFGGPGYMTRSPEAVVDEIEMLHRDYGVSTIKITDEMFILKPSHYLGICDLLIERGLGEKLNIWCYGRPDTIKPATLAKLRDAGIRWIALGIESGNQSIRDGADKDLRMNDIVGIVREIQKAGINVIGNFMFGFEHDTIETMQETLDLAQECNVEFANFYTVMALPGSRLYDKAIAKGWTLPAEWRNFSQHNRWSRPLDTEFVSAAEVTKFRDEAFNRYFSSSRYLGMVTQRFGWDARKHIEKMTTYKLEREIFDPAKAVELGTKYANPI